MNRYIVTVKLSKNPKHNPKNKKTGICPVSNLGCSDITGEHHSFIGCGNSIEGVIKIFTSPPHNYHVTRVERVVE